MQMTDSHAFDFVAYALKRRQLVEEQLEKHLIEHEPKRLWESMRYSVLSGGKRLRALICMASAEAVYLTNDGTDDRRNDLLAGDIGNSIRQDPEIELTAVFDLVLPCCCAIEMVHAMSLIHDDLPCMDNDDLRRGKPTNHKVYGEAVALLAGDALLMLANQILISKTPSSVAPSVVLAVVAALAKATGAYGMVGGQIYDLACTGLVNDARIYTEHINTIETIHKYKTGALIRFSAWAGARLANADTDQLTWFENFAEILGLAFQIADDLLDFTGDAKDLGKTPGKDEASKKATWVTFFGLAGARTKLAELESNGLTLLDKSNLDSRSIPALKAMLQYAIHRTN